MKGANVQYHGNVEPELGQYGRCVAKIRILLFSSLTFKSPEKTNFLHNFFCLLLFEATLTSFFKETGLKLNVD